MEKWCSFKKAKMTMMEAIELLDLVVDESDPDVSYRFVRCND